MASVLPSDLFSFENDDDDVSPSNTLFPPSLSFPGLDSLDNYLSPNDGHSPRFSDHSHLSLSNASDSPSSSLSFQTDEYLLSNSFGADELDMLIFPDEKPDVNFLDVPSLHNGSMNASSFDSKPPTSPYEPKSNHLSPALAPTAPMGAIQPPAFDGLLQQWRMDLGQNIAQNMPAPWMLPPQQAAPPVIVQPPPVQPMVSQMQQQVQQPVSAPETPPKDAQSTQPPPRRSAPNAPLNKPTPSPPANVGKHNKTERRYRQKVQQAQADLRDAVPALRVLYGTSNEEQKASTDVRAPDGTVDGLGEVTRPNASAKATILIGARMYIELLQRRTAMLQRKVAELETYRLNVSGQQELDMWRADFDGREAVLAAVAAEAAALREAESGESEEEEEEEPRQRKRARTTKKAEPKVSGAGVRAFAAFAVSFSLMPSASKMLQHAEPVATGAAYAGKMSKGQVIARLPLITAEHGSRLLSRALPEAFVPAGPTIVNWLTRIAVIYALFAAVWAVLPAIERRTRKYQDQATGAGNPVGLARDLVIGSSIDDKVEWNNLAACMVGGLVQPSAIARFHVAHRLGRSSDPYSLALLALLSPEKASSRKVWADARSKLQTDSPLAAVLALPLHEASRSLEHVPATAAPIAAIAEQINLVHLYDLYSRFFVRLVSAVGVATSLQPMLSNVQDSDMAVELRSLDREIRGVLQGVPRHSTSHALGLVLLGLWGLFSGYQSPAVLVSALAVEEVQGAGPSLSSVSAMLELLYPGSSNPATGTTTQSPIPSNALAIDKLAIACIGFVDLLFSSRHAASGAESRQRVQKETARLRLVLTQATFVGFDEDEDERAQAFDDARQRLVAVLCAVGRRAAGRGSRDEDSGIDDMDDW